MTASAGMPADRAEMPNDSETARRWTATGSASRAPARAAGERARLVADTCLGSQSGAAGRGRGRAGQLEQVGERLVGAPPGLVVVGDRHDDDLVGAVGRGELLDLGAHLVG